MLKVTIKMKFLYLQNNLVEKKILILFDFIIIFYCYYYNQD
jgi:hypothetical protein